jgi:hypothetical protein
MASSSERGNHRNDPNQHRLTLHVFSSTRRFAAFRAVPIRMPTPSRALAKGDADRHWLPCRFLRRCSTGSMARGEAVGLAHGGFVRLSRVTDRHPADIELLMREWHRFSDDDYDNDNDNGCVRCSTCF